MFCFLEQYPTSPLPKGGLLLFHKTPDLPARLTHAEGVEGWRVDTVLRSSKLVVSPYVLEAASPEGLAARLQHMLRLWLPLFPEAGVDLAQGTWSNPHVKLFVRHSQMPDGSKHWLDVVLVQHEGPVTLIGHG